MSIRCYFLVDAGNSKCSVLIKFFLSWSHIGTSVLDCYVLNFFLGSSLHFSRVFLDSFNLMNEVVQCLVSYTFKLDLLFLFNKYSKNLNGIIFLNCLSQVEHMLNDRLLQFVNFDLQEVKVL